MKETRGNDTATKQFFLVSWLLLSTRWILSMFEKPEFENVCFHYYNEYSCFFFKKIVMNDPFREG